MTRCIRSTWLTFKETRIYCIDFSGLGSDRAGLGREIEACEAQLSRTGEGALLVTVDLHQTVFSEDIAIFFNHSAAGPGRPFRKMAILGVSPWQRFWYTRTMHVTWPKCAHFFYGYDPAKEWLLNEGF
jgi:hypothetical protein